MKKQMISIGIAAVLMIGTAGAFAGGAVQKIGELIQEQFAEPVPYAIAELPDVQSENQQRREVIAQRLSQQENAETMSLYDQMIQALEATAENPIDFNNVVYNYEYLKQVYHLEDTEMDYIANLIIQGYDPMTVMDICYFWLDTSEEIQTVENIYALKGKYRSNTWIENAFNEVTQNRCGVLTTEDVDEYMGMGITAADIRTANKLCRRGVLTIQEILAMRLENKSFAEIAAIINGTAAETLPAEIFAEANILSASAEDEAGEIQERAESAAPQDAIAPQEVLNAEILTKIEGAPLSVYYEKVLDGESLEDIIEEKDLSIQENIISELRNKGLYKAASKEEKEEYLAKEEERNA